MPYRDGDHRRSALKLQPILSQVAINFDDNLTAQARIISFAAAGG
jgi:hypothetical protein